MTAIVPAIIFLVRDGILFLGVDFFWGDFGVTFEGAGIFFDEAWLPVAFALGADFFLGMLLF